MRSGNRKWKQDGREKMELKDIFPVWEQLTPIQQDEAYGERSQAQCKKGTVLHRGSADCIGLLLVQQGAAAGRI